MNILFPDDAVFDDGAKALFQVIETPLDDFFGRAGARGDENDVIRFEPIVPNLMDAINEVSRLVSFHADFA